MDVTQRDQTRNQSTADYQTKKLFIFDNRYTEGIYKNTSGGSLTLKLGMLVARSTAVVNGLIPVTADNLADIIGIAAMESDVVLANNATVNINYGAKGGIDANLLVLPAATTLNTVVGTKTVRDILEGLGFHVDTSTVDNTKFDN